MSVAYNNNYKHYNLQNGYYFRDRSKIPSHITPTAALKVIYYKLNAIFHGICLGKCARQFVTGTLEWLVYTRRYHLPSFLTTIIPSKQDIIFGGKGRNRVIARTLDTVTILVPLPFTCYFGYRSVLMSNDISMLFELKAKTELNIVTHNDAKTPHAELRVIHVIIPLQHKFKNLYYCPPDDISPNTRIEYLFSTRELAQIHRNLSHATAALLTAPSTILPS